MHIVSRTNMIGHLDLMMYIFIFRRNLKTIRRWSCRGTLVPKDFSFFVSLEIYNIVQETKLWKKLFISFASIKVVTGIFFIILSCYVVDMGKPDFVLSCVFELTFRYKIINPTCRRVLPSLFPALIDCFLCACFSRYLTKKRHK